MDKEKLQQEDTQKDSVNEFKHSVNVDLLSFETGLTIDEIAQKSGIKEGRNLGKWKQSKKKGGTRPTYEAIATLFDCGASVEALFGIEYKPKRDVNLEDSGDSRVQKLLQKMIRAEMKNLGLDSLLK
ncbi:MAG: hypothetical protein MJY89_06355 [Bacteroidales bacterium]|nr:hypothetical protein [Bacteroidales bacterium]